MVDAVATDNDKVMFLNVLINNNLAQCQFIVPMTAPVFKIIVQQHDKNIKLY